MNIFSIGNDIIKSILDFLDVRSRFGFLSTCKTIRAVITEAELKAVYSLFCDVRKLTTSKDSSVRLAYEALNSAKNCIILKDQLTLGLIMEKSMPYFSPRVMDGLLEWAYEKKKLAETEELVLAHKRHWRQRSGLGETMRKLTLRAAVKGNKMLLEPLLHMAERLYKEDIIEDNDFVTFVCQHAFYPACDAGKHENTLVAKRCIESYLFRCEMKDLNIHPETSERVKELLPTEDERFNIIHQKLNAPFLHYRDLKRQKYY